jgi:alpha-ketoglutarate-dependent taurine dioxygenase
MFDANFAGASAWSRTTPLPGNAELEVPDAARDEMLAIAACLAQNPLPTEALMVDDFQLDACRALMSQVKHSLDEGHGFSILTGLPWDVLDESQIKAIHWLTMSLLGRTVAQKWNGLMVYDVMDTGKREGVGAGVRGSKTNGGQGYHTDNSYNLPPDYVGLTCLRTAREGGLSGLVSFESAHNRLRQRDPDLLERLYEPFIFERYDEFAPGDSALSHKPMFEFKDGQLGVALSTGRVRVGYEAAGKTMDSRTTDALDALDEVLEDPELGKTFEFEPGQTQIVNNRKLGHRRTAFVDWPEPEHKRQLVRIWVRHAGRRFYAG